ncbi:MAG: phosphoribosylaminoimidazolesuccinocarboxamide synthase [Bacteroidota bacterium]
MTSSVLTHSGAPNLVPSKRGKVRDLYELDTSLMLVATDRLSAFDVVLPDGIPGKGKVLTQISAFWFRKLADIIPNHIITTEAVEFPEPFRSMPEQFAGRSMLVRKTRPLPVECVARGYISGSGWNEYKATQSICGIKLPAGLVESDRLNEPIFTPSSKAEIGVHDENITFDDVVKLVGKDIAGQLRDVTMQIYREAAAYAETRGIIIADTKFEFGLDENDRLVWIDEALTPDSSRFWPKDQYAPGGSQPSYDKQFVRDYLLSIKWDKRPPGPHLPEEIIRTTGNKYADALRQLTGSGLE